MKLMKGDCVVVNCEINITDTICECLVFDLDELTAVLQAAGQEFLRKKANEQRNFVL